MLRHEGDKLSIEAIHPIRTADTSGVPPPEMAAAAI